MFHGMNWLGSNCDLESMNELPTLQIILYHKAQFSVSETPLGQVSISLNTIDPMGEPTVMWYPVDPYGRVTKVTGEV